jgi:hypothetical protein
MHVACEASITKFVFQIKINSLFLPSISGQVQAIAARKQVTLGQYLRTTPPHRTRSMHNRQEYPAIDCAYVRPGE